MKHQKSKSYRSGVTVIFKIKIKNLSSKTDDLKSLRSKNFTLEKIWISDQIHLINYLTQSFNK